ncbi:hypothetical protein B0T26DRAFT_426625 [Lasiosphaeria miniovina]|uniref:DUF6570 domain-containing protein n=1 Tax=Lasiosphaeria miniovina TaxID=1954250 RepID=A0AA40A5X5_9PEZI|nr:uncharacterized protein B0T26DRAFT_426625 [Lasiosphaeria miniovina]KAK0709842.1 hypothetical protein B0T26DRAFT_426625 [Lasiosphaeria miniovina]
MLARTDPVFATSSRICLPSPRGLSVHPTCCPRLKAVPLEPPQWHTALFADLPARPPPRPAPGLRPRPSLGLGSLRLGRTRAPTPILPRGQSPAPPALGSPQPRSGFQRLTSIFHRRGQVEGYTPEQQAAHDDRLNIQRRHRSERRQGQVPSATPPSQELLARPPGGDPGGSDPGDPFVEDNNRQMCPRCWQYFPEAEFRGRDHCRACDAELQSSMSPSQSTTSQSDYMSGPGTPRPTPRRQRGPAFGSQYRPRASQSPVAEAAVPLFPTEENPVLEDDLAVDSLLATDRELLQAFQARIDGESSLQHCPRCRHSWYNLRITGGICAGCHYRDDRKPDDMPNFFSAENNMDLGDVPDHLPKLTQVEEQLIARVHVFLDVRLVRGQQYRYSKHCVSFLRDTGSLYNQLPRLPRELDIVIVRPRQSENNNAYLIRSFRADFRVRRAAIETWLRYLIASHRGYSDIQVDVERLAQLPEDGNVMNQVAVVEVDEEVPTVPQVLGDDEVEDDDFIDYAAAPNLIPAQADLARLRDQVHGRELAPEQPPIRNYIELPGVRSTPLNDLNNRLALISLSMPTLMPRGLGEYTLPRVRAVDWSTWVKHALFWHDGRFARHPRFPYVVFNTIMRAQVNKKSKWLVNRNPPEFHREVVKRSPWYSALLEPTTPSTRSHVLCSRLPSHLLNVLSR